MQKSKKQKQSSVKESDFLMQIADRLFKFEIQIEFQHNFQFWVFFRRSELMRNVDCVSRTENAFEFHC